ncbi:hypothetical protein TGFOU_245610 [Toxoplasma gondii FOU]|uniref:Uncharacterized protein n=1 Tax=Toxoplasma gondii FOU TaxID=943167 RepID=A0A086JP71_TOXGO|nr:hypothetical protein TGFOU_245610 [Toxoplasma gondii FOU]
MDLPRAANTVLMVIQKNCMPAMRYEKSLKHSEPKWQTAMREVRDKGFIKSCSCQWRATPSFRAAFPVGARHAQLRRRLRCYGAPQKCPPLPSLRFRRVSRLWPGRTHVERGSSGNLKASAVPLFLDESLPRVLTLGCPPLPRSKRGLSRPVVRIELRFLVSLILFFKPCLDGLDSVLSLETSISGTPLSTALHSTIWPTHLTPPRKRNLLSGNYLSHTLRLAHEQSFFSLFANTQGMAKYEASDVIGVDGSLYTVFDSSYAIGHTSYTLRPFDDTNYLIGNPKRTGDEDSQWEAITYDEVTKRFFIVREAIVMEEHTPWTPTTTSSAAPNEQKEAAAAPSPSKKAGKVHKSKTANHGGKDEAEPARSAEVETRGATKNAGKLEHYHAVIEEVEISEKSYKVVQACRTEFSFSAQNKGFEGVISLRDTNGKFFLLGLCEGNYCKGGAKGRKRGNGRLVLMEKVEAAGTGEQCIWTTVRVLHLPREVAFTDYSSIAVRGSHLAITSQEDSVVWLGKFNMPEDKPNHSDGGTGVEASVDAPKMLLTDPAALEVVPGGQVLNFPRDEQCNIIYCNIEGIAFAGRLLVTVADKVKAWQDPRCMATDQRVHAFVLPPNFKY